MCPSTALMVVRRPSRSSTDVHLSAGLKNTSAIYWISTATDSDPEHAQRTPLGDVEICASSMRKVRRQTHPPHIHLRNFQILDRNGQALTTMSAGGGHIAARLRHDVASSRDSTAIVALFDHCHNLEHEDYDMMMRFDVVSPYILSTNLQILTFR